ncbi:hypothetical protein POF50_002575 [Streptomyces sp. SL13]|uniref:DNA-directed RNA polymerase specialized sigma24 family protein n=1 Tax=Streptantibioticus silvisoli TaxID=2705255 RepID=A0AA90GXK2_9ACTN|nr:hypothetical protein [Streptantibioticus silvisoli]MDI5968241.1 hypothetical protein [Streptantibioticus silvisoli]
MDTQTPPRANGGTRRAGQVEVDEAEAALVEHYARLVRIAYVTLPATLSRHRRVMLAHRVVQRALPRRRTRGPANPAGAPPAYALVRTAAVRGALEHGRARDGWRRPAGRVADAVPLPPLAVGLRLFPRSGGAGELALERALSDLTAPARAAFALLGVDRLAQDVAAEVLADAGVEAPRRAVRDAVEAARGTDARLLASGEFDPCVLLAGPPDLLRRRQHVRAAVATAAALAVAVTLLAAPGGGGAGTGAAGSPGSPAASVLDPASVLRGSATAWRRSDRLGFAAWPARGARTSDAALLGRALTTWGAPGRAVRVSASVGTVRTPPAEPPRLLFAGDVDGAAVVLFYDGVRLVRYAEPLSGGGPVALDFARADGATGASASAVLLDRSDGNARYLTAPWVAGVSLRNLLTPGTAAQPVRTGSDGVTDPVPTPAADAGCGAQAASAPAAGWPAVVLAPRPGVPGGHPMVLTDLGDLTPVHLTYAAGAGARQGEASGAAGLAAWAHSSCELAVLRGTGVRTTGAWDFAQQTLPDGAGVARWLCTRADLWSGDDHVLVQFLPPGSAPAAPAAVSAATTSTAACGPMTPAVLSGVLWKSPAGRWFLVAAGSPEVASLAVSGGLRYAAPGRTAIVPAASGSKATLSARLTDGTALAALK